ncbi:MAG: hypothetical protein ABIA04_01160 [Pseudomonadota bacterium]
MLNRISIIILLPCFLFLQIVACDWFTDEEETSESVVEISIKPIVAIDAASSDLSVGFSAIGESESQYTYAYLGTDPENLESVENDLEMVLDVGSYYDFYLYIFEGDCDNDPTICEDTLTAIASASSEEYQITATDETIDFGTISINGGDPDDTEIALESNVSASAVISYSPEASVDESLIAVTADLNDSGNVDATFADGSLSFIDNDGSELCTYGDPTLISYFVYLITEEDTYISLDSSYYEMFYYDTNTLTYDHAGSCGSYPALDCCRFNIVISDDITFDFIDYAGIKISITGTDTLGESTTADVNVTYDI